MISELLQNKLLTTALFSWGISQVLKVIINLITSKSFSLERLFGDGGMPSSHSATVSSLATATALYYGLDSPYFAISCVFALIVMHDAKGVRLETGKQAKMLNEMLSTLLDREVKPEEKLKELVGHTPLQVLMGCLLGIFLAFVFYYFL